MQPRRSVGLRRAFPPLRVKLQRCVEHVMGWALARRRRRRCGRPRLTSSRARGGARLRGPSASTIWGFPAARRGAERDVANPYSPCRDRVPLALATATASAMASVNSLRVSASPKIAPTGWGAAALVTPLNAGQQRKFRPHVFGDVGGQCRHRSSPSCRLQRDRSPRALVAAVKFAKYDASHLADMGHDSGSGDRRAGDVGRAAHDVGAAEDRRAGGPRCPSHSVA